MGSSKKWKESVYILGALILLIGLLFAVRADVYAAGKKKALNVTNISLSVGQSRKLSVSNTKKVKWISSKKSVVSVSKKGKIKAKKAGKATITANISGKKLKCNVIVNKPSVEKKDILIVYFSQTGTTQAVAKKLQKLTGGDLLRVKEKDKYTSNYDKLTKIAKKEIRKNARPKITTEARNMKSYDVIYVGYPIWWGATPRVVNTFLEKYDLAGKTVIPFCTSGGSDIDGSLPDLKKSCEGATFKEGYTADTGSMAEIRKWLTQIGELGNTAENSEPPKTPEPTPTPLPSGNGKILVAYFSWSGTSERIAQNIIAQTGADSFRIERETPYSTDYTETAYGDAKTEADNNARPPIKNPLASVAQYDKIILCYPIWWHTAPMTVGTFLESYDLSGKHIYPVSQSASMDRTQYNQSVSFIKECAKGAAVDEGIFSKNNTDISTYIENTVLK
ncbi:MAG: hypothetical protein HFJ06_13740 [Lachnospiraceae bacterium]|nr:hypothetical protein [Lachnospiraceae bacterium]